MMLRIRNMASHKGRSPGRVERPGEATPLTSPTTLPWAPTPVAARALANHLLDHADPLWATTHARVLLGRAGLWGVKGRRSPGNTGIQ